MSPITKPIPFDALPVRFRWMRDYLARVAPPGRLPGRQHIDPIDMRIALSYITLVDVVMRGIQRRFRFRLVGTEQVRVSRRDMTGWFVDEAVTPELCERILGNLCSVMQERTAIYDQFPIPFPGYDFLHSQRVYFPLAGNGHDVDMILVLADYRSGLTRRIAAENSGQFIPASPPPRSAAG